MSTPTSMTRTVENVPQATEPPPIVMILPLLQFILAALALLFRLGVRLLLAAMYPLRIIGSVVYALLSPIIILFKITLDLVLFTPFSIIRAVAVALYPVYAFCAVACIVGITVGILGRYVSTAVFSLLARSRYFALPPSSPTRAVSPSGPQAMLRRRKRKYMRLP